MKNPWSYRNPVSLRFGAKCFQGMGATLPPGKLLVITTAGMIRRGAVEKLKDDLGGDLDWFVIDRVTPNPEIAHLEELRASLSDIKPAAILGFGGGSAIDTAKILSVILRAPKDFDLRKHLEGKQEFPTETPLPFYAIPTTSGTGAEVTPFATVWAAAKGKKFSFASPRIYATAAWIDPEYTASVTREVTISTGLDAFSQALESIWNRNANSYTQMLASRAASLSFKALKKLEIWPPSPETRAELMEASLFSGLAISHTRTALAHSMSYPITAHFGMPHGLACSFMLPELLRFNSQADDGRLLALARMLGFNETGAFASGIATLFSRLEVPVLVERFLPDKPSLLNLIQEMFTPGRSDNNFRPADSDDLGAILEGAADRLFKILPTA